MPAYIVLGILFIHRQESEERNDYIIRAFFFFFKVVAVVGFVRSDLKVVAQSRNLKPLLYLEA